MKRTFIPMLAAVGLLATDHSGVRPRATAKDYPAHDSADGFTIAAGAVPTNKVKGQLSPDLVSAGYTVLEIAVYPDPGNEVDVFAGDFTLRIGPDTTAANPETPVMVARSIEAAKQMDEPKIPSRVPVHGEQTVGVAVGGRDPVTGRRSTGVYTETGVSVGNPRGGYPADPDDPRYPDPTWGGTPSGTPKSLGDKLAEKALPEGKTTKAVAGYVYFPQVSPRLVNSNEPYHLTYKAPTAAIHLTVPAK